MAKPKQKVPIMSEGDETFMAFEGLVQWTAAAIEQGRRVDAATFALVSAVKHSSHRSLASQLRTEHHYFSIAANKVFEYRDWVLERGLCSGVDFSMLANFDRGDVRDLRNMREHVVDYFTGFGRDKDRWEIETPEFKADASSCVGTVIGGRLDWKLFVNAVEELLPALLAEPIPFPPH